MASTNKTAALKLNQWVDSDPVLREDFNADNTKLDAAIEDRSLVFLKRGTLTSTAVTINIPLTDLDLSKYIALRILWNPIATPSGSDSSLAFFSMNNLGLPADSRVIFWYTDYPQSSATYYTRTALYAGPQKTDGSTTFSIEFYLTPTLPGTIACRGSDHGSQTLYFYVNPSFVTKSNLVNLQIFSSDSRYPMQPGSKYILYGLKG